MEEYLEEIPRDQFVKHYMDVWQNTFKDTTIHAAFQKSRAWPINHDLFQDADFAPSINTSTVAWDLPDSYPVCAKEWPDFNHGLITGPNLKAAVMITMMMKILVISILVMGTQDKLRNVPTQQQWKHCLHLTHTFPPQFHLLNSIQKPPNPHSMGMIQRPIFPHWSMKLPFYIWRMLSLPPM